MSPNAGSIAMNLTSPRFPTFFLSLALVMLAAAGLLHVHVPAVGPFIATHRVGVLMAAYAVLAFGVVLRGL